MAEQDEAERERRRQVIDEARALVDRLAAEPFEQREFDPFAETREWRLPEPEPPPRRRGLDTMPVDWAAHVRAVIAREREFQREVLAEIVAEIRAAYNDDLERALRTLNAELTDLKATLAEYRLGVATEKAAKAGLPLDLPRLPLRGGLN